MAYKLNKKLSALEPYEAISGEYEIRLDANESFIEPNEDIKRKIDDAVKNVHFNRYPDASCAKLRKAFADAYGVSEKVVVAGNGSDELISVITASFLEKGDRIITLTPDFSMYAFYGKCAECEPIAVNKDENFAINIDAVLKSIEETGARMIIFSNPCNPTSVGFSAQDMRRLVSSTDILVVIDEAYMDFWNESLLTETEEYDNLIVLKTCSKAVGFAAVRLGFAVSNTVIANALNACRSPYNVNTVSQEIGKIILSDREYMNSCVKQIIDSKNELYSLLMHYDSDNFKVFKSNTNFIYIKTPEAQSIFERLKKYSIVIRCFKGALRITAGTKSENERLIVALDNILSEEG